MCINPSHIYVERGPFHEQVPVPCKTCWQCKANRVSDYVGRSLCEASTSDWTVTLTLTYAPRDDFADKILTPSHAQAFIRAFRRAGHKVRYLMVGEYGEAYGRAHFHCILFGKGPRLEIPHKKNTHIDEWPHGHVYADWSSDDKALRYVCKYLLSDDKSRYWFSLSKKPALGFEYFAKRAQTAARLGVLPSAFEYRPPGGDDRPYLLTGASRRDYLFNIVDALYDARPQDELSERQRERMSQWVRSAYEKGHLNARVEAGIYPEWESWRDELLEEMEPGRLRQRSIDRLNLDLDPLYGVGSPNDPQYMEWWENEKSRQQDAGGSHTDAGDIPPARLDAFIREANAVYSAKRFIGPPAPLLLGTEDYVSSVPRATRRDRASRRRAASAARASHDAGTIRREADKRTTGSASSVASSPSASKHRKAGTRRRSKYE